MLKYAYAVWNGKAAGDPNTRSPSLPEDATIEDAIERLCFMAKVEEGLRQSEAGQVVPHEEILKQFGA